MRGAKTKLLLVALLFLPGCVTNETVRFQPNGQQQALMRDGNPALVSRKKNSIVLIRPASREFRTGGRPVFVVGINNLTNQPLDFRVAAVDAHQIVNERASTTWRTHKAKNAKLLAATSTAMTTNNKHAFDAEG